MRLLLGLLAPVLALITVPTAAQAPQAAQAAGEGPAWQAAQRLQRGVNVLGYDPLWKYPAKARFQSRHFKTIRSGGFDFVRVVLFAFDHMDASNRLDSRWLATLDKVVRDATAAGLGVILDEHDFDRCSKDPGACEPKLRAFWQQVGARYAKAPDTVLFELLNEPHGALDAARWNVMLASLIAEIRISNPRRTLVIGPTRWNNLEELPTLALPTGDRNIIATFHSYEPFRFTHQGASWAQDLKDLREMPFTPADEMRLAADFDKVAAWSKRNDRPVLLGEFGAYDKSGTPLADRVRYTAAVRREAEKRRFPWAYWQFDSDFVVYDIARDRWIEPIRAALIP